MLDIQIALFHLSIVVRPVPVAKWFGKSQKIIFDCCYTYAGLHLATGTLIQSHPAVLEDQSTLVA